MFVYKITNGELFEDGKLIGTGYSGHGEGINNPSLQSVASVGPICEGEYIIGESFDSDTHGPIVMRLTPKPGNKMNGRSGFLMHGDLKNHPGERLASLGCIIMPHDVRKLVANSACKDLKVIR